MSRLESDLFNYKSKYEENGVLVNKLGITNQDELNKVESMITTRKLAKLYLDPGKQTFDVNHYLSIHKYLFDDIYPFAGEIRSENITKPIPFHPSEHMPFCLPQYAYGELDRVLKNANRKVAGIDSRDKLLVFITELISDLDIIHPFREGNGRCEREYIRQLIEIICKRNKLDNYYLDFSSVERDKYINAMVKADVLLQYGELLEIFNSILKKKEEEKEIII